MAIADRAALLRYALAPACVAAAVVLHLSPAGPYLHPTGLFLICIVAAAWFGGAGPGFLAAVLATFALPQLIPMSYPLVAGFFDLPRFVTFGVTGLAVGWGSTRRRRAEAALRLSEDELRKARSELEAKVVERTGALQASEERYALATTASEEGFWDWIPATDDFYASPRMLEMYGFPPGTVFATRAEFLARFPFHPEDRPKWEQAVAAHFAGKTARFDIEIRLLRGGETRWLHLTGLATRDVSGAVTRWTGATTDVTARKSAQDALRLSEERFALAVAGANDGIWDWNLTTDMAYFSPRAQELLGRKSDGVDLKHKSEWDKWHHYHPDDAPVREAALREHLEGRTPFYEGEWRVLHPNGTYHWILGRGICERDGAGRPVRFAGSTSDIDARKRTEEELKRSEERYALAMQASGEGHWDWKIGADQYYTSPRHLEILGLPPGTTSNGRAEALERIPYHPEDRAKYDAAVAAHFAGKTPRVDIQLRLLVGGELRWVHAIGMCLRDAAGVPVRWAGSMTDITERKRAEEALQLSEQRYERAMLASEAGYWDWDVSSDEFYVSPKLLEMGGFPAGTKFAGRADFMQRSPFHSDDRAKWEGAVKELFAGTRPRLAMEVRVIVAGKTRWHNLNGICIRDADGKVVRWSGSSTEVTARKSAEEALRISEERYARAMEGSDAGHWDWNIVTDEMFVSPRAREMLALPEGPLPARRSDIMALVPQHPDDQAKMGERVSSSIRSGSHERDYRVVPRPGEVRWVRSSGKVYKDARGAAVRMTGSLTDITERRLAAEALRLSEERYALALEASAEGHFDTNLDTDELFVSQRLNEMYGFAPHTQFTSRSEYLAHARFHPDDVEVYRSAIRAAEAQGGPERYEFEYRIVPRAGEIRWLHTRGQVMRDAAGRARRRIGVVTDITERRRAADELRESEARFRSLVELSSDWYWKQDENLRFTYSTAAIYPPDGYPGGSAIGKTRWELPGIVPLSSSWAEHQALLAARKPFRDFEYSRPAVDGTMRYVSSSGAPIFDQRGRFMGYQGVGRNITERKRIEEELRARQEMLELAQKSARAIAFEWRIGDGEGENRWSPDLEAMYGLAPGTYDGSYESWKRLVHPDDWSQAREAVKHAQRTGDVACEYRVVHPDGSVHWLQAKGRMFFDREAKPARMVGFMHDVTERRHAEEEFRRMERQLRQAQRLEAMGTLAGGIAHDFNNILGAILGYGEMALRDAAKGSRLRRDLDSIITAGERGRALVDRVLAFSRSGVGERVAVNVEKVAREAVDLLTAKLPPNVTLHAKLHAGRAAMLGDATQVHQVLMNLATNAIQAMPAGGTLRVSLDTARLETARMPTIGALAAADYVVLQVSDTGTGIAPEIVERIFDPFFTTKEVGTGTGLGLSLVHGIVTELGGAIDVASTPGKGSMFTVYLPRTGDASDVDENEEAAMPRGDGERVLIVDDEEPLVRLATRTLEELGYAPTGFTSSAAALAAFRADPQRFDALITDERMPGMSGSALIREVRGIRGRMPIVLMSGYVGGAITSGAREAGAEEVLKKPLSARDLAASLARVLHP